MIMLFLENTVTSSPEGTKASFWLLLGVDDSYQTAETLGFFCFGSRLLNSFLVRQNDSYVLMVLKKKITES